MGGNSKARRMTYESLESVRNLWRGSLLSLECVALTKIGNGCQIFGAATQPNASKLARHKGIQDGGCHFIAKAMTSTRLSWVKGLDRRGSLAAKPSRRSA